MTTELLRQIRRRRTLLGLVGTAAVPVLIAVALVVTGGGGNGDDGGDPTGLFQFATASGLNFALVSIAAMSPFLLLTVVALFTGDTVSSEASWGSLRYLLTRPVPRSRLLGRKLAVGVLLSLVAVVLVPVSGAVAGTVAFGWGGVQTPFGALPADVALLRLAAITAYVAWSAAWVAALAFLLSTVTDAPVGAVAGTIVITIVVQILDAITALGALREWLPTHESIAWLGLLATPARPDDLTRGILLQVPYVVVLLGLAFWRFQRRDILS
jgi:ABC-2 type transport system permease protein